jgi:hypothetical protein
MRPYTKLFPDWKKRKFTRNADGHPVHIERCGGACGCYGHKLTVRERNEYGTCLDHEDEATVLERYHPGEPDWIDDVLNEVSGMPLGNYPNTLTQDQRGRIRGAIEEKR